jgi:hypothetical protein
VPVICRESVCRAVVVSADNFGASVFGADFGGSWHLESLLLDAVVWLLVVEVPVAVVECDLHQVGAGWFSAELEVFVCHCVPFVFLGGSVAID